MDYKWSIPGKAEDGVDILRYVMSERGFNKEQMKAFVSSTQKPHDPFLFKTMKPIIARINKAIENNEIICIIGDYDCDGVTSTYTMYSGLKYVGANVIYKLPHRVINGYGLKEPLVDYAKENGATLIITVDNGVAAADAVAYAKSLGIDVIVTDHHEPQEVLPDCLIIDPKVNTEYPFDGLCGCGVAFKVISALIPDFENTKLYDHLMEILAIGTVADAMQLVDENRTFVIEGMKRMNKTSNVGLKELFIAAGLEGKKVDVDTIGFFIGPNVNAAGRVDSPDVALNLFLSDDCVEAKKHATKMLSLNEKRKDLQKEAVSKLEVNTEDGCIIGIIDSINAGIGGIIASKVVDLYKKPCFIFHGNKEIISASGRTFGDFNIMDCIVKHRDVVEGGGGHKSACGVAVRGDRLNEFREVCNQEFSEWLEKNPDGLFPTLPVTCQTNFSNIDMRLINNLNKLKPFGNGNSEPKFVSTKVEVLTAKVVGKNQNVIQFTLRQDSKDFKAVGFEALKDKFMAAECPKFIDILYTVGLNEFPSGTFNIQLMVSDFKDLVTNQIN